MIRPTLFLLPLLLATAVHAAEAPLDPAQSKVEFTGHATLHDFHGAAQRFNGRAEIDDHAPGLVTSAVLEFDPARLTTFQSTRDKNMSKWLHADTPSPIRFELTRLTVVSGDPAHATRAQPAQFNVQGKFTLNGVTRPLSTRVTGWRDGRHLVVEGTARLDTTQFGLPIISQFFLTVDRQVDVSFHLVFDLPPAR